MFFWKKKKKVVLRCFTTNVGLPELFPLVKLSKALPEWWHEVPAYLSDEDATPKGQMRHVAMPKKANKSIKHCYAIQKLWENSIAIPAWSDLSMAITPEGQSFGIAPNNKSPGNQHRPPQYPGMLGPEWVNWKTNSPWLIYTDQPVSFMLTDPFYHNQDHRWITMPGELEFFYQHHSNLNLVFRRDEKEVMKYEFSAGAILAYLTPCFDEEIEIICETITEQEKEKLEWAKKISFTPSRFMRNNKIGGCPFGKD